MNLISKITAAVGVALLEACVTNPITTPYDATTSSPKDKTAVLISMDRQQTNPILATIVEIDGSKVNCSLNSGCPVWARVTPGNHIFTIHYRTDFHRINTSRYKEATLPIKIENMKALHVYAVRYSRSERDEISYVIEDLGERPQTGIAFPFGVKNPTEYKAEF